MSDAVPEARTGPQLESPPGADASRPLARRVVLAVALFAAAAIIGYGLDGLNVPERLPAIAIVLTVQLTLCVATAASALVAPRWSHMVLALTGPLLAISIGAYDALVEASLQACFLTECAYLVGTALIVPAGPLVQILLGLGAWTGYACAALTVSAPPALLVYTNVAIGFLFLLTVGVAFRRGRAQPALQRHGYALMQQEHARATALLDATTALTAAAHDGNALATTVTDQLCRLFDADWAVCWERREPERVLRPVAISGLPPMLARAVRDHALDPHQHPMLYDRLSQEPTVVLAAGEVRRLLPIDMVAPLLRGAVACAVPRGKHADTILLACYATARGAAQAHTDGMLSDFAHRVSIAQDHAQLLDDFRRADRAKTEFIATLSHELRTPINVVMGYADLLAEGVFGEATEDQLEVLNRIRHQSAQLLDLLQPMLDLSRLESRQTALYKETFQVADLVRNLQLTIPSSWCKPGVSLSWQAPAATDVTMHSDRSKIEMIVRNLIHNALKYTDQGEVSVTIEAGTAGQLRVTVRDTGTGIAAVDLPTVFEIFQQSSTELPRGGGVGLGLYIVKRLTDALGGRINVESKRGSGSTFTLTLPLEAPSE